LKDDLKTLRNVHVNVQTAMTAMQYVHVSKLNDQL
jgi:hypothetical protein